jgi:histidyl-tRNA synthetase
MKGNIFIKRPVMAISISVLILVIGLISLFTLPVEQYPDKAKMDKQFKFAEKKGIQFAVLVGEEEIKQNQFKVKDLVSGEQATVSLEELVEKLK